MYSYPWKFSPGLILVQGLGERTDLSKLNKEFGCYSKQSKSSEIRGARLLVSVTLLINKVLNIRSTSHELNEKLTQQAAIQLGENDC